MIDKLNNFCINIKTLMYILTPLEKQIVTLKKVLE